VSEVRDTVEKMAHSVTMIFSLGTEVELRQSESVRQSEATPEKQKQTGI
jgi:hypothetical protein